MIEASGAEASGEASGREASGGDAALGESAPRRIELLTRPGCSLCTTAREIVRRVTAEERVSWDERDVDEDPELADEYGDRVPVVLLDGHEHAYWRVDEQRLREALHGRRSW